MKFTRIFTFAENLNGMRTLLICLCGCLFYFLPLQAHKENYFRNFDYSYLTEGFGLPNNDVNDLLKDSQGYIWAATNNGLGRFDGYRFVNFSTETLPLRLRNNGVTRLLEDKLNRLWIGLESGIQLLDLHTYRPVELSLKGWPELRDLFTHLYIHALHTDKKGRIWIAAQDDIWMLTLQSNGQIADYYRLSLDEHIPVNALECFMGDVVAGIGNNVYRLLPAGQHRLTAHLLSEQIRPFSEDWRILCLREVGDWLWMGTNRGLFKFNRKSGATVRYRYSNHRPGMLSQAYITDIATTSKGDLLVATLNGLNVYDPADDAFYYIRQYNNAFERSLNCNFINCLLTENNNIWVGTEIGGINLLTSHFLHTTVWQYNYQRETSISPNPVNAISQDNQGRLWIGTVEGGLNRKDPDDDRFIHYTFSKENNHSISNNTLTGLLIDSDNHLWAYTWGVGINELDLNNPGQMQFERHIREDSLGLEGDFLGSACEDTLHNGIWFGTTIGLHFYNKADRRFYRISLSASQEEVQEMNALLIDRQRRLWVGTSEGVFIFSLSDFSLGKRSYKADYLRYRLSDSESRVVEKINCIFQDRKGNIWLGSNGNGLYRFEGIIKGKYRFRNYTVRNGLPNMTIMGIVEDAKGLLWISTNAGLSRMETDKGRFTNYTKEDGLPSNQFYRNACYYSVRDNLLYFGMINGLVAIRPDDGERIVRHERVVLTAYSIAGNMVYPLNSSEGDYSGEYRIEIHERDRNLSIDFSSLNFGKGERVRYAWRLKDFDTQWSVLPIGEHTAHFNGLPAGDYVFEVKATDEYGHWSDAVTQIPISVTPYFYKTIWFYLLMAALIITGINAFISWRVRSYRKQKNELEREVAARTLELKQQNEKLEEAARHIQQITDEKINFFTHITHEFRTPVTLIGGPIKKALSITDKAEVKEQLEIARRSADRLNVLVNELLDFRNITYSELKLQPVPRKLSLLVQDIVLPFKVYTDERNISLDTYFRLHHERWLIDVECVRRILVNLLSNALKYTPEEGRIAVFVYDQARADEKANIHLVVRDSGCGFDEGEFNHVFDAFYRSSHRKPIFDLQESSGIGLAFCKQIVELLGGEIQIGNNRTGGAFVHVVLPLVPAGTDGTAVPDKTSKEIGEVAKSESRKTILLVEDNEDMRHYICTLLQDDYRVLEAGNGQEGLEVLHKEVVNLIISDLMMPVMDGTEFSRRVKDDLLISHLPIIILTAIHSDRQQRVNYQIGVDEYIAKPFDEEILKMRIRYILEQHDRIIRQFQTSVHINELPLQEQSKDQLFMDRAFELMAAHYSDAAYGLTEFVRDLSLSKTLVNHKFQSLAGMSTGVFMKNYRLRVAREMIERQADITISEIAYQVGFNDPKYFSKCFKEMFGCLPGELNKRD